MANLADAEDLSDDYVELYCEDVSKYEMLVKIGQGSFGEVFKARLRGTDTIVALKKVLLKNEERFSTTTAREIHILQSLQHNNVINLMEICCAATSHSPNLYMYLVLDFCEHDLAGLLSNANVKFALGDIKTVLYQLLSALEYIHSENVMHRDVKPANVLVTQSGILKLADFGLARPYSCSNNGQPNRYANQVVTLWYRPPELLLGETNYGPKVDMWGAGCIMAEMWTRCPIMQGKSELHQLTLITRLCGSINTETFPNVDKLKFNNMELLPKNRCIVKERLGPFVRDMYALDLLDKLLTIDPVKRVSSFTALDHDFFWLDPPLCDLSEMLSSFTQSVIEYHIPKKNKHAEPRQQPHYQPHYSTRPKHNLSYSEQFHPAESVEQYKDRVY